jgi:hypothetical protein
MEEAEKNIYGHFAAEITDKNHDNVLVGSLTAAAAQIAGTMHIVFQEVMYLHICH